MQPSRADGYRPEWASCAEWTRALVRASTGRGVDERLERVSEDGMEIHAAITGGELWQGGALVPEPMLPELRVDPLVQVPLRELCSVWPMTSGTQRFPYMFDDDRSGGAPYGVQYRWEGDDDTDVLDESSPTFAGARARAKSLEAYMLVDYPLVMDAAEAFETAIARVVRVVYNWILDKAIIRGSGAGEPLGILNAPGTITVTRGTASQFGDPEIDAMVSRLLPACAERAAFILHPSALGEATDRLAGRGMGAALPYREPARLAGDHVGALFDVGHGGRCDARRPWCVSAL